MNRCLHELHQLPRRYRRTHDEVDVRPVDLQRRQIDFRNWGSLQAACPDIANHPDDCDRDWRVPEELPPEDVATESKAARELLIHDRHVRMPQVIVIAEGAP